MPLQMVRALSKTWPREDYNYEDVVFGFKWFFDCSTWPKFAAHSLGIGGDFVKHLLAPLHDIGRGAAVNAMSQIFIELGGRKYVLTDKAHFGLVPDCNIREGDEIWILLGCSLPSVLRKQPNGTYEHICTARIPTLMDDILGHKDIRRFSPKAEPGEHIGEWTIEDIELV